MLGDCPNDWQDTSLHEETVVGGEGVKQTIQKIKSLRRKERMIGEIRPKTIAIPDHTKNFAEVEECP